MDIKKIENFFSSHPTILIEAFPYVFNSNNSEIIEYFWETGAPAVLEYLKNIDNNKIKQSPIILSNSATLLFQRFNYLLQKNNNNIESVYLDEYFKSTHKLPEALRTYNMNLIIDSMIESDTIHLHHNLLVKFGKDLIQSNQYQFILSTSIKENQLIIDYHKNNTKTISIDLNVIFSRLEETQIISFLDTLNEQFEDPIRITTSCLRHAFKNNKVKLINKFWKPFAENLQNNVELSETNLSDIKLLILQNLSSTHMNIDDLCGTTLLNNMMTESIQPTNSITTIRKDNPLRPLSKGFSFNKLLIERKPEKSEGITLLECSLYGLNPKAYKDLSSFYGGLSKNEMEEAIGIIKKYEIENKPLFNEFLIQIQQAHLDNTLSTPQYERGRLKI